MNLVNGMIVDGLGHVSLDGVPAAQGGTNLQQAHAHNAIAAGNANIHQGSIPATGRKGAGQNGAAVGGQFVTNTGQTAASGRSSTPTTPMSAPNSLQFNHLIGGAISPNLVSGQSVQQQVMQQQLAQGQQIMNQTPANAHVQQLTHQQQTAQIPLNHNMLIGDYVQGANNIVLQNYRQ